MLMYLLKFETKTSIKSYIQKIKTKKQSGLQN